MSKFQIPLGVGSACTARVGQYLGAMQPLGAMTACRVAVTVQGMSQLSSGYVTTEISLCYN